MGMVVSFRRVTPEELDKARADPFGWHERAPEPGPEEPDGYLDKSWAGLEFLFDQAEVPITLMDPGDLLDDEGAFWGWSVGTVAETAHQLRAAPFEQLARHYDPARMTEQDIYPSIIWERDGDAIEDLRSGHEIMARFFERAAATGSAAIMHFSF